MSDFFGLANHGWLFILGIFFGYFLEVGGLGSPHKLTAQLSLRDWTVFKVMFTSILVAAVLLYLSSLAGLLDLSALKIPTPFYLAMAVGGALLGVGMAVGGYCPGTSVVGLFSGRLDALFFILGMFGGVLAFSLLQSDLQGLVMATKGAERETLVSLSGWPTWLWLALLAGMAVMGYGLAGILENRSTEVDKASRQQTEETTS